MSDNLASDEGLAKYAKQGNAHRDLHLQLIALQFDKWASEEERMANHVETPDEHRSSCLHEQAVWSIAADYLRWYVINR